MFVAVMLIVIGAADVAAAVAWFALRHRRSRGWRRTTATVVGSIGRPADDLRAMVLKVVGADGRARTVTDTFYSSFAAGRVGQLIAVDVGPPGPGSEPGSVRVPRQSDPTLLLNALLAAAGIAFVLAGMFVLMQAAL